jgi:pimeloyl-ACP methyl ester carboxylesterase
MLQPESSNFVGPDTSPGTPRLVYFRRWSPPPLLAVLGRRREVARVTHEADWILNTLIGSAGFDVLHPGMKYETAKLGYGSADFDRVFARTQRGEMLLKAWVVQAADVERRAAWAESEGFPGSAGGLFGRAALLYGRAAYTIFGDDPVKSALHARLVECHERMVQLHSLQAERVVIPFGDQSLHAILHRPKRDPGEPCPAIVLLPGMDMFKEEWTRLAQQTILPLGAAALSLDGPGQGESLLNGVKVSLTNYDDAGRAAVDWLASHPAVASERIGLAGFSFGAYWAARLGAAEPRLRCVAAVEGVKASVIFRRAQPNYRRNFMYMAGIENSAEFDELVDQMTLDDVVPRIRCPSLFVQGEFDELRPVEDALRVYELAPQPKELWILEDQFHPMGEWADELPGLVVDWLLARINGAQHPGDRRLYLRQDGTFVDGDASPPWWRPAQLVGGQSDSSKSR